jgi:hypothetical protein
LAEACCPGEPLEDVSEPAWSLEARRHFEQPAWWKANAYVRERLRPVDARPPKQPVTPSDRYNRDLVTARTDAMGDVSPRVGGRAQRGDVFGLETGGERTSIGETSADEGRHRGAAERAPGDDDPRRSER